MPGSVGHAYGVSDEAHDERRDAEPADKRKPTRRVEQVGERAQVPVPPEVDEHERQHGGGQHPAEGPEDLDREELGKSPQHGETNHRRQPLRPIPFRTYR